MTIREPIPTYRYVVEYVAGEHTANVQVSAAYLQEEGRLVVFKDASHAVVFAVSANMLLSVERRPLVQEVTE